MQNSKDKLSEGYRNKASVISYIHRVVTMFKLARRVAVTENMPITLIL